MRRAKTNAVPAQRRRRITEASSDAVVMKAVAEFIALRKTGEAIPFAAFFDGALAVEIAIRRQLTTDAALTEQL